jgi:hypothetical protein
VFFHGLAGHDPIRIVSLEREWIIGPGALVSDLSNIGKKFLIADKKCSVHVFLPR